MLKLGGTAVGVLSRVEEQLLSRNVQRFRGVLVFEAHRLVYHSILGVRVIKKKKPLGRSAAERTGNNSKGFKNFYLKAKARTWP